MAELTRRATSLIKEMLTADGKLPAFNVSSTALSHTPDRPHFGMQLARLTCANDALLLPLTGSLQCMTGGGGTSDTAASQQPLRWHPTTHEVGRYHATSATAVARPQLHGTPAQSYGWVCRQACSLAAGQCSCGGCQRLGVVCCMHACMQASVHPCSLKVWLTSMAAVLLC